MYCTHAHLFAIAMLRVVMASCSYRKYLQKAQQQQHRQNICKFFAITVLVVVVVFCFFLAGLNKSGNKIGAAGASASELVCDTGSG